MKKTLIAGAAVLAATAAAPETATAEQHQNTEFTIFMQVKTTPTWLALSPETRFAFLGETIEPILRQHPSVKMSFFDTEFYNAEVTDIILWETAELSEYQAIIEALRETSFWGEYFEVVSILPGVENAYADAYDQPAIGE